MTDAAAIHINQASSPRYSSANELPPYSYVPGHGLPHPVNDPAGHLHAAREPAHELPIDAATLAELEGYTPACWHTSRTPVVRVLAENLRLAA